MVIGGYNEEGILDDIWVLDIGAGEWSRVRTVGPTPPARAFLRGEKRGTPTVQGSPGLRLHGVSKTLRHEHEHGGYMERHEVSACIPRTPSSAVLLSGQVRLGCFVKHGEDPSKILRRSYCSVVAIHATHDRFGL